MSPLPLSEQHSIDGFYSSRTKKAIVYFSVTFLVSFITGMYTGRSVADAIGTSFVFAAVFAAVIWCVWIEG